MRSFFLLSITTLVLLVMFTSKAHADFPDVQPSDWYAPEVQNLVEKGIVEGYPDGRFGSWDPINRAELAVVISRLERHLTPPWWQSTLVEGVLLLIMIGGGALFLSHLKALQQHLRDIALIVERQQQQILSEAKKSTASLLEREDHFPEGTSPQSPPRQQHPKNQQGNWWM